MKLRAIIDEASKEYCKPLKDLTVLSSSRDPYRLDTPANHKLGEWLKAAYHLVNPNSKTTHLRGLHYMLVGRVDKPNGEQYTNTDDNWQWFSSKVAKAARWLGYIPWELIRDARNAPPQIFTPEYDEPTWVIKIADIELSIPDELKPRLAIDGHVFRQPYRQVIIAEKQGVQDVLQGVCSHYDASMVLPAGEISDSLVYGILKAAADDGRPLVIHQLGDFDPSGNQMAVSTARTVQGLRDSLFPDLTVIVNAIGLTLEQCEAWNLPTTPLKETEKRAEKWIALMGREQTELDAAVALVPDEFSDMVKSALSQYYDDELFLRSYREIKRLENEANQQTHTFNDEQTSQLHTQARQKLVGMQEQIKVINDALKVDIGEVSAPCELDIIYGDVKPTLAPLLDTRESWIKSTDRMIKRKALLQSA